MALKPLLVFTLVFFKKAQAFLGFKALLVLKQHCPFRYSLLGKKIRS